MPKWRKVGTFFFILKFKLFIVFSNFYTWKFRSNTSSKNILHYHTISQPALWNVWAENHRKGNDLYFSRCVLSLYNMLFILLLILLLLHLFYSLNKPNTTPCHLLAVATLQKHALLPFSYLCSYILKLCVSISTMLLYAKAGLIGEM